MNSFNKDELFNNNHPSSPNNIFWQMFFPPNFLGILLMLQMPTQAHKTKKIKTYCKVLKMLIPMEEEHRIFWNMKQHHILEESFVTVLQTAIALSQSQMFCIIQKGFDLLKAKRTRDRKMTQAEIILTLLWCSKWKSFNENKTLERACVKNSSSL